jgi:hypothetical protein
MKLLLLALVVTLSAIGARTSVASEPSQFVSEVIPIKYARAADVAAALLKTTNSVATGGIQDAGQPSVIADERTNSLLISATREDVLRFNLLFEMGRGSTPPHQPRRQVQGQGAIAAAFNSCSISPTIFSSRRPYST